MNFFNRMTNPEASQQVLNTPISGFGGGMFGFGGRRQPVQQAPMPVALPVAHSATPIGQHAMGPQGAIPTGPQGMHQSLPQGQAYYQQRQNEIAAAQQAQANQPTLASMLRNSTFRGGFGRFGGGGSE